MKEQGKIILSIIIECFSAAFLTAAVTMAFFNELIWMGAMFAAAAILFFAAFFYKRTQPAPSPNEKEQADADYMKKYNYEKSSLTINRIVFYIVSAAAGVIVPALVFASYRVVLLTAPVIITALTIFGVNKVMFGKTDVKAPVIPTETEGKEPEKNREE